MLSRASGLPGRVAEPRNSCRQQADLEMDDSTTGYLPPTFEWSDFPTSLPEDVLPSWWPDYFSFWPPGDQVFAGLEEQARQAMMKTDFPGDLDGQRQAIQQLRDQDSSSSEFCTFW